MCRQKWLKNQGDTSIHWLFDSGCQRNVAKFNRACRHFERHCRANNPMHLSDLSRYAGGEYWIKLLAGWQSCKTQTSTQFILYKLTCLHTYWLPFQLVCIYVYVRCVCLRHCTLPSLIKFTYFLNTRLCNSSTITTTIGPTVTTKGRHHTVSAKTASIWTSHFGKRTSLYHTRQLCCTRTRGKLTAHLCMLTHTYIYLYMHTYIYLHLC